MKIRKKVVMIALDYDPTAKKVAEIGYEMAKAMHAEVTLLHIVGDPVFYSEADYSPIMGFAGYMDIDLLNETSKALKEKSHLFLEKTKHHLGDAAIKTLVSEGDFADSIMKIAKDIHADVIVLGSHSRRWLDEILMGSVSEKILHHSTIPLFIIPTKQKK